MILLFSLDVEGSELQILKTIPFDQVDIKVIDVEFKHLGRIYPGTFQDLNNFLKQNGYEFFTITKDPYGRPNDAIYVKKGFVEELNASSLSIVENSTSRKIKCI